jgi:hypothetical protein
MAGTVLGFMKFVLGFDTIAFKKGMTAAERDLVVLQKKVQKFGKGMTDIGKKMSVAITAPLIAFAASGVKEAQETVVALGKVNNALAQTGAVAGQSTAALSAAADALELHSLYEADEILSGVTSRLLLFGKIAPQNFQLAQQAAVDFAQLTGTSLEGAAVIIGKALSSPTKGLKALQQVGVTFTKEQTKHLQTLIDTGHAAEAQGIIFDALKGKVTGAAQVAQNTDPWNKLTDAYKQMAEKVGTALLPHLINLSNWATEMIGKWNKLTPETQAWITKLVIAAGILGPMLVVLGHTVTVVARLGPLVKGLAIAFGMLGTVLEVVAGGLVFLGPAIVPLLPILIPLAAMIGAVYLAFKHWDEIVAIAKKVYTAISTYLSEKLKPVFAWLADKIRVAVGWFQWMADKVVLNSIVPDMVDAIGAAMLGLEAKMVEPTKKATEAVKKEFENLAELKERVAGLLDRLFPDSAAAIQYQKDLADIDAALEKHILTEEAAAKSRRRLSEEWAGDPMKDLDVKVEGLPDPDDPIISEDDWQTHMDAIGYSAEGMLDKTAKLTGQKTAEMAKAWGDMASQAIFDMKGMVDAFKSGDILGGIQQLLDAVLNVLQALQKVGVIGGTAGGAGAGGLAYGGARALGGPVVPGKSYMVGENGPEFFTPKRSGFVSPSGREAQPQRVVVVPSPYFDVVVDHRAANVAAPMAGQAAVIGVTGSEARLSRRSRRNLLAA